MLNSLIIFLREVLEAAIIVSVLLASLHMTKIKGRWLLLGILAGLVGSVLMANQFSNISDAFDGVGQEIANASMLFTIATLMLSYLYILLRYPYGQANFDSIIRAILFTLICIAVIREGVEVIIYISGYIAHIPNSLPLLIGGSIGTWIGVSAGIIIYYSLQHCAPKIRLKIIFFVLTVLCAGMISEGVLYLIQADWIDSGRPLWDSSSIISESSVLGQLLYAIFAYEATPAAVQVIAYGSTLFCSLLLVLTTKQFNKRSINYLGKR